MALYGFCQCFLYPRTECIMQYQAVRKFYQAWGCAEILQCYEVNLVGIVDSFKMSLPLCKAHILNKFKKGMHEQNL